MSTNVVTSCFLGSQENKVRICYIWGVLCLQPNNLLFNTYYMADRMYMQYSPSVNEVHPEQQLYVHCSVYMRSKVKTIPIVHVDPERLCP
jgi:hypothetical protein